MGKKIDSVAGVTFFSRSDWWIGDKPSPWGVKRKEWYYYRKGKKGFGGEGAKA